MSASIPTFFVKPPELKQRLYNGRKIMVFEGRVKIASISGWLDNPRIDLAKRSMQEKVGQRDLSQDEIFALMKNEPEVRLKELRDDILKNGLREPITLSFNGKLLDGNRRFFAVKFALDGLEETNPARQDLQTVPAFVLTEGASDKDEEDVLVEENFSASLKIEWPDYVKAQKVVQAKDEGHSDSEIANKFKWSKGKIKETLKIAEIIQEFETFATDAPDPTDELGGGLGMTEQEAQVKAAKSYQYFNEAQKSFFEPLKADIDFKLQFFKWINEDKFRSFPEVRVAYRAWKHPEARSAILQTEPTAAKNAKAILDYNDRVVKSADEAVGRIESFIKFLNELKVDELRKLPAHARENLKTTLELVTKMIDAASDK